MSAEIRSYWDQMIDKIGIGPIGDVSLQNRMDSLARQIQDPFLFDSEMRDWLKKAIEGGQDIVFSPTTGFAAQQLSEDSYDAAKMRYALKLDEFLPMRHPIRKLLFEAGITHVFINGESEEAFVGRVDQSHIDEAGVYIGPRGLAITEAYSHAYMTGLHEAGHALFDALQNMHNKSYHDAVASAVAKDIESITPEQWEQLRGSGIPGIDRLFSGHADIDGYTIDPTKNIFLDLYVDLADDPNYFRARADANYLVRIAVRNDENGLIAQLMPNVSAAIRERDDHKFASELTSGRLEDAYEKDMAALIENGQIRQVGNRVVVDIPGHSPRSIKHYVTDEHGGNHGHIAATFGQHREEAYVEIMSYLWAGKDDAILHAFPSVTAELREGLLPALEAKIGWSPKEILPDSQDYSIHVTPKMLSMTSIPGFDDRPTSYLHQESPFESDGWVSRRAPWGLGTGDQWQNNQPLPFPYNTAPHPGKHPDDERTDFLRELGLDLDIFGGDSVNSPESGLSGGEGGRQKPAPGTAREHR